MSILFGEKLTERDIAFAILSGSSYLTRTYPETFNQGESADGEFISNNDKPGSNHEGFINRFSHFLEALVGCAGRNIN